MTSPKAVLAYAQSLEAEIARPLTSTELHLLARDFARSGKPSKATMNRIKDLDFNNAETRRQYMQEQIEDGIKQDQPDYLKAENKRIDWPRRTK